MPDLPKDNLTTDLIEALKRADRLAENAKQPEEKIEQKFEKPEKTIEKKLEESGEKCSLKSEIIRESSSSRVGVVTAILLGLLLAWVFTKSSLTQEINLNIEFDFGDLISSSPGPYLEGH